MPVDFKLLKHFGSRQVSNVCSGLLIFLFWQDAQFCSLYGNICHFLQRALGRKKSIRRRENWVSPLTAWTPHTFWVSRSLFPKTQSAWTLNEIIQGLLRALSKFTVKVHCQYCYYPRHGPRSLQEGYWEALPECTHVSRITKCNSISIIQLRLWAPSSQENH